MHKIHPVVIASPLSSQKKKKKKEKLGSYFFLICLPVSLTGKQICGM
jgi:hypothetical protein